MRKRTWIIGFSGAALASTAVLTACGGDDNTVTTVSTDAGVTTATFSLPDGAIIGKILIDSITTAPNTACPAGGTTIEIGNDANGNGMLDPSEITSTQEVCSKAQILTTTTPTGADEKCAYGGTIVQSGADTNGDGILQPGEVTTTQEICGGGFGATLTTTTPIPVGSVICPLGGVETKTGVDNGAGGGTAGDGILQSGEVVTTTDSCTTAMGYDVQSFAPPPAVANQPAFTIQASGGAGLTTTGGNGSTINITKGGTLGGHLKVFKTGLADASFTLPTYTPSYGATKYDVTTSTTLSTTTPTAFPAYYVSGSTLVYATDANTSAIVTGLHVAAGVTLTLPGTVTLTQLTNDIVIEGTVAAAVTATTGVASALTLNTQGAFVGASTGTLSAVGTTGTSVQSGGIGGGSGGAITIFAGYILNQAAFNSSGGAATGTGNGGGAAGQITLTTDGETYFGDGDDDDDDDDVIGVRKNATPKLQTAPAVGTGLLYNTGALTANGGAGAGTGQGGMGGTVVLRSAQAGLYNSGAIVALGAAGTANGPAGNGGRIELNLDNGDGAVGLYNSGALTTSGGTASTACTATTCTGGSAGQIDIESNGGTLVSSGALTATGGAAVNAAATGGLAQGGNGGNVSIYLGNGETNVGNGINHFAAVRNLLLSGTITTNGGTGSAGGGAGPVTVNLVHPNLPNGQEIQLLGYTDLIATGGDGATNNANGRSAGATGGQVYMSNNYTNNGRIGGSSGSVINYANLTLHGGKATVSGTGGVAGYVSLQAGAQYSSDDDGAQVIVNYGAIDMSGGDGFSNGGNSGECDFVGSDGIQNAGTITGSGGKAAAAGGHGGTVNGAGAVFTSGGVILNSAAIAYVDGSGTGATSYGGDGGQGVSFTAQTSITNSGALSSKGGNSTGEIGGTGGSVSLTSHTNQVSNTGTLTAAGGTGTTTGAAGTVTIDGVAQ